MKELGEYVRDWVRADQGKLTYKNISELLSNMFINYGAKEPQPSLIDSKLQEIIRSGYVYQEKGKFYSV